MLRQPAGRRSDTVLALAHGTRNVERSFDEEEMARRVRAQLDTLVEAGFRHVVLSAFGGGAFRNPTRPVAAVYAAELRRSTVRTREEKCDVSIQRSCIGPIINVSVVSV